MARSNGGVIATRVVAAMGRSYWVTQAASNTS